VRTRKINFQRFLLIIPFLILLSTVSNAITGGQLVIRGRGRFKTVGINAFWDPGLSQNVTEVDWGTIENGTSNDVSFFLQSASNVPVLLNITTANYIPPAANESLTLTWDYDGSKLYPDDVIQITLTLWTHTKTKDLTDFAFDIIIFVVG
jgi:hypothetical protein